MKTQQMKDIERAMDMADELGPSKSSMLTREALRESYFEAQDAYAETVPDDYQEAAERFDYVLADLKKDDDHPLIEMECLLLQARGKLAAGQPDAGLASLLKFVADVATDFVGEGFYSSLLHSTAKGLCRPRGIAR